MARNGNGNGGAVSSRVRAWAAGLILATSIAFFLLWGLGEVLFGQQVPLREPAVAFFIVAVYALLGINLPELLRGKGKEGP